MYVYIHVYSGIYMYIYIGIPYVHENTQTRIFKFSFWHMWKPPPLIWMRNVTHMDCSCQIRCFDDVPGTNDTFPNLAELHFQRHKGAAVDPWRRALIGLHHLVVLVRAELDSMWEKRCFSQSNVFCVLFIWVDMCAVDRVWMHAWHSIYICRCGFIHIDLPSSIGGPNYHKTWDHRRVRCRNLWK